MPFLGLFFAKRYQGTLSYEAPNPVLWDGDPCDTAREGLDAIRRLMDLARPVND
jgi:hypothetical protein